MIVEIAAVVTAIATASSAIYMIHANRMNMRRQAPAIRVHSVVRDNGRALVNLTIFPTDHHVVIRQISTNGAGISQAPYSQDEWGAITYKLAHSHRPSIDVNFDLLPAHVSSSSLNLHLSVELRKSQSSFQISFHSDVRRLIAKHRISAITIKETD